ncbi:hypothetical protein [Streptomyces sp. NBC_00038]|uniref:hypothetical protein n=1 Tax=Streptomyces sp. NBC_00038 TaxID=2903615 RepID=UPI00225B77BE|nr:hypothetical protein [Streptomyces sp. NBC_00038]MCX5554452.1 hypothetical protein [Streptomyces sp. NBC_00038]
MDPVTAVVVAAAGSVLRLGYRWLKFRAQARHAELDQQGLLERTRSLPPGSRLIERTAYHDVDMLVGSLPAADGPTEGCPT